MTVQEPKGKKGRGTRIERSEAARVELNEIISASASISQLRNELSHYPMELFRRTCELYKERNAAVPDYLLGLAPYLGDVSLRALEESELIEKLETTHAMYAYVPTRRGEKLWQRLESRSGRKIT